MVLESLFKPFFGVDMASIYTSAHSIIDFILYLILFLSIAKITVGKKFNNKALNITIGVVFAIGMTFFSKQFGFTIANLGPLAGLIFIGLIGTLFFRFLKDLFKDFKAATALSFILILFLLKAIVPQFYSWIIIKVPIIDAVIAFATIISVIILVIELIRLISGQRSAPTPTIAAPETVEAQHERTEPGFRSEIDQARDETKEKKDEIENAELNEELTQLNAQLPDFQKKKYDLDKSRKDYVNALREARKDTTDSTLLKKVHDKKKEYEKNSVEFNTTRDRIISKASPKVIELIQQQAPHLLTEEKFDKQPSKEYFGTPTKDTLSDTELRDLLSKEHKRLNKIEIEQIKNLANAYKSLKEYQSIFSKKNKSYGSKTWNFNSLPQEDQNLYNSAAHDMNNLFVMIHLAIQALEKRESQSQEFVEKIIKSTSYQESPYFRQFLDESKFFKQENNLIHLYDSLHYEFIKLVSSKTDYKGVLGPLDKLLHVLEEIIKINKKHIKKS